MIYEKTNWILIKEVVKNILNENCDETNAVNKLKCLFQYLSSNTNENDLKVQYLQYFLYKNYTNKDIRDRKVTARNFEDFISLILDTQPTDSETKPNPSVSEDIATLQNDLNPQRFNIMSKLSSNKREKSDTFVLEDGTNINIKTLKGGTNYNKSVGKDKVNTEINIGSLCYESTFYKLLTDTTFSNLSDRTKGLGSAPQLFKIILSEIFFRDKYNDFKHRLNVFLEYLYKDDFDFIAFKSDYQMHIFQFYGNELVDLFIGIIDKSISKYIDISETIDKDTIINSIEKFDNLTKKKKSIKDLTSIIEEDTDGAFKDFIQSLESFVAIFYRWENNNLRIQIDKLIDNSVWNCDNVEDMEDIPYYISENIKNPFRKENLIVLDFKHLEDSKVSSKIDEINQIYLDNIKKNLELT